MTEPTKRPWSVNIWSSGRYTIESESGQVCELNLIHLPGSPKANAELIVRAVNNYEALLEAAKDLLKMAETLFDDKDGEGDPLAKHRQVIAQAEK